VLDSSLPTGEKREGGISEAVKVVVTAWWTEESRVSPNRKDIRRKRLGRNVYDTHPAHLLMETQVHSRMLPHILEFVIDVQIQFFAL